MTYSGEQLRRDQNLASVLLSLLSAGALWYFYRHGELLLSGDAVAHINIARRVFDSRTPGPKQLGTVWLPLQHILSIPFLIPKSWWQTGIGGSVVSAISYVVGGRGMLRLVGRIASRPAAWLALSIYALNPNLLFVQSTALNESLALAALIWATAYFSEFLKQYRASQLVEIADLKGLLWRGTGALAVAMLTRYDGWFLAAVCWAIVLIQMMRRRIESASASKWNFFRPMRKTMAACLICTALVPSLWFTYNYLVYGNALEFANGPYSAKAIAERTAFAGASAYPGYKNPQAAAIYFQKDAKLIVGEGDWPRYVMMLAAAGSILAALAGEFAVVLMLWSVFPFYVLSIAYGGVPLFIPVWWPFSYYNTRYGLQLLPAIAVGFSLLVSILGSFIASRRVRAIVWLVAFLTLANYVRTWRAAPICLREVRVNGRTRIIYERLLANEISKLPPESVLMIYVGNHAGALQQAGRVFKNTINEGNRPMWQNALPQPASAADFVIAAEGDPVGEAVKQNGVGLEPVATISSKGQPATVVYRSLLRH